MKKIGFKKAYLIFLAVMLGISCLCILYIRNLLVKYEASQPEREVERQIELLHDAAIFGKLTEVLSFESYEAESEEQKQNEINELSQKLRNGTFSYSEQPSVGDLVYNIKCDDEIFARVTLENTKTKTKLIVFNFKEWKVKSLEPAIIDKDIELPLSIGMKINGEIINGTKNEKTGMMVYSIRSLTSPEIVLCDAAGNEAVFASSHKLNTYGYKVCVPSNYKVYAGEKELEHRIAKSEKIADYEYIYEYCPQMPTQLTYDLHFLKNDVDIKIKDNMGNDVPFEMENRSVTMLGQVVEESLPGSIKSQIDVLDAAQQWSLFMSNDLKGTNHGYATIKKLLIEGSYLQEVAWKWATGVDITFTSPHKLGADPFVDEEITDFVQYSEKCFSCTVKFRKHMILIPGNMTVMDPVDSTFYFVNIAEDGKDPIWRIAEIRDNTNE